MRPLKFDAYGHYDVSPAELWPYLSDTGRLNRAVGLRAVHFTPSPRDDGGSTVVGEFRWLGRTIAVWTEHAFDFVRPRHYRVLREYTKGPIERLDCGVEMTPEDGGTTVHVFAEIVPRNLSGMLLCKLFVGPASTSRVLAQCRVFEAVIRNQQENPFPQLTTDLQVDQRHLDELVARLESGGADPAIARRLRERLLTASDEQVVKMRAFEVADEWGTDRYETLVVFLRATTVGLLRLGWDVLCPNCRVSKAEFGSLSQVGTRGHCDVCNIMFDTNFDRLVEVRFTVAPSIREASMDVYCVGGPRNTPHIVAQKELAPGEVALWTIPEDATVLRIRSPQAPATALIDVSASEGAAEAMPRPLLDGASPSASVGEDARIASGAPHPGGLMEPRALDFVLDGRGIDPAAAELPSGAIVAVRNALETMAVVHLEERFWPETAATAALVSTMQEFRDLFAADVLAPGIQVGIERLAFLFTDVAGSTRLYEAVGQARAFRIVQEHFRFIQDAVRTNRGAIVKTIGDAVMAVFPTALQAARAAFDMQRAMESLAAQDVADPRHFLRVGLHVGPCLAVNLNDRLDYFGTTVNMAARVEHEAGGGQIAMSRDTFLEPGVADLVHAESAAVQEYEAQLRGITSATTIVRIDVDARGTTTPSSVVEAGQPTI